MKVKSSIKAGALTSNHNQSGRKTHSFEISPRIFGRFGWRFRLIP
jgi:hypothetical protein